ncbi:TBC1 domain family member 12 isoform X2 [Lates calcarifer]|uniref:TBC1 domain family member 12 isoform X2 n=1 Tax=Lates calcarifer TaxID=8187 RepID=A0AAJ7Q1I6_LATCA|nr:TBC1 domain family member 12 isoform X2 [Lates calcarifer]
MKLRRSPRSVHRRRGAAAGFVSAERRRQELHREETFIFYVRDRKCACCGRWGEMERTDDGSLATVRNPAFSADVITGGQQVTCSGEGEDITCAHHCDPEGPIRSCSDVTETDDHHGAGLNTTDDVTSTLHTDRKSSCSDSKASRTEGSKVNPRRELDGLCSGGATASDSGSQDTDVTFDLPEVGSDDEEAFVTEEQPAGQSTPPTAAAPRSRNTFECGRRQSAPSELGQDDGGESGSELQSRRPGIVEYFSRKQRSVSHCVPGWKLFGKVPPRQSPSKQAQVIQQEFEARSSPTHHATGQQSRRKVEFEPLSTTALILEDRPPNLPAKSADEAQRHRQQYEQMVARAKRRELKEAQRRQQQREDRFRQEEVIANATLVWNQNILPHWDSMKSSRRAQDLWWGGLPPSVRGRVWSLAIGNELNVTAELYEIFLSRAREKRRELSETESDDAASLVDRESSLELITQDISRTFRLLCVFQKGGPYHDLLQSILGAYACYRPDVGYVQGMSSIAAVLILNMDEIEAFVSFSNLMNRPCQLAFYRVDHQLMFRYFGAFQVFLEETLPRLFLYFQSLGLTPDLYLMDWILSLYTKPLPLDVACRVWDVFFRDGEEFLFRTALGILRLYQDVLLHMDLISIAQFLSRLPDEELLSDRLFSCISATPMLSGNRKWSQVLTSCRDSGAERQLNDSLVSGL